jgi:hypothetical protein
MMNAGTSIFFTSPTTYLFMLLDSICFSLLLLSPTISAPLPAAATGPDKVLALCASCLLAGAKTGLSPVSDSTEVTGSSRLVSSPFPSLGDSPYSWCSAERVAAKIQTGTLFCEQVNKYSRMYLGVPPYRSYILYK